MATNDELIDRAERARGWRGSVDAYRLIDELTTALRAADQRIAELERDRERLDWLEHGWIDGWDSPYRDADGDWMVHSDDDTIGPAKTIRDVIDAAMSAERGE